MDARRVISGTWGGVWLDGEKVAECYGLQLKQKYNKEKLNFCGEMGTDYKTTSTEGTGTIMLHKVNSRLNLKVGNLIAQGKDPRFTIVSELADPDAAGAERVAVYGVSFDEETIADWEAGKVGKISAPFTFTRREFLDVIEP